MDNNLTAFLHIVCSDCADRPADRACIRHTCLDCGQPTLTVHGLDGQPCPREVV